MRTEVIYRDAADIWTKHTINQGLRFGFLFVGCHGKYTSHWKDLPKNWAILQKNTK